MATSDRLFSLNRPLQATKNKSGFVCVSYKDAYIKDAGALIAAYGRGETFETACDDYFRQVSGKTLVFDPYTKFRTEITVL